MPWTAIIDTTERVFTAADLLAKLHSTVGLEEFSALLGHPYLVVDLRDTQAQQLKLLHASLPQLPCPVIALGSLAADAVELVDVVAANQQELQQLTTTIEHNPLTAMTLVQLLRHNARVSIADGLLAESLAYATLQGGEEYKRFLASKKPPRDRGVTREPPVLYQRDGDILNITLNRPAVHNAFSTAMRDGLVEALNLLAQDSSIEVARIRGAGASFSVGGDLDEFGQVSDATSGHAIRSTRNAGRLVSQFAGRIECHVHGACIGAGIELPAFCDRIVAEQDSFFLLPEVGLGLVPGAGGTVSILHRIGRHRTAWMALSGQRINAETALSWGLINEVVK